MFLSLALSTEIGAIALPAPSNGQLFSQGTGNSMDSTSAMISTGLGDMNDDTSNSMTLGGGTSTKDSWAASYAERPLEPQQPSLTAMVVESSSNGFGSEEEDFEEEHYTPRPTTTRATKPPKEKNPLSKVGFHRMVQCGRALWCILFSILFQAGRARKNVDYTVLDGVEKKFSCNCNEAEEEYIDR